MDYVGQGQGHLDWVAPSFWSAAAALLDAWADTRLRETPLTAESADDFFGAHRVFRGQANPWAIVPSALRGPWQRQHSGDCAEALRRFLESHLPEEEVVGLSEYASLSSLSNAAAVGQHYGLPTHWVDFSFNPLVALHFASLDANAAAPAGHPLPGHGVLYSVRFGELQRLQDAGLVELHLELLPPWVMKRWYQQSGFHLSCNEGGEEPWRKFTAECEAIHFPRPYPKLSPKPHALDETSIARMLAPPDDPFYSVQTQRVLHHWYPRESFIEDAIQAIVSSGAQASGDFTVDMGVEAARRARTSQPPWMNTMFGVARGQIDMIMADPMRLAMHYLFEASSIHTPESVHLDPATIVAFGEQNQRLFGTFDQLAQKVNRFDLPWMHELVAEACNRWNDWVRQTRDRQWAR